MTTEEIKTKLAELQRQQQQWEDGMVQRQQQVARLQDEIRRIETTMVHNAGQIAAYESVVKETTV